MGCIIIHHSDIYIEKKLPKDKSNNMHIICEKRLIKILMMNQWFQILHKYRILYFLGINKNWALGYIQRLDNLRTFLCSLLYFLKI